MRRSQDYRTDLVLIDLDDSTHSSLTALSDDPTNNHDNVYFTAFVEELATSDEPLLKGAAAYIVSTRSRQQCDLEAVKQEVSWAKDDGRRRDIGICVQIRNDAGVLDEYIAFHWLEVWMGKKCVYIVCGVDLPLRRIWDSTIKHV